ncbi:MAG: DUF4397 domain-containing protein [Balneolia bacterium]|nr:DUF4397 domain-containing protein [Balneolia bacterium]
MALSFHTTVQAQDGTASVQIIHNSADPAVAEVDIYVNGDLFLSNVPFRGATEFVELATEITYDIVVTPAGASINDGFSFEDIALEDGESYYVVATGVATPGDFAANPDDVDTGFFLDIIPGARAAADEAGNVDFKIYHGATDAPAVDVIARNVATLAESVSFTGFTPEYLSVPAAPYIIDVNVAGTETTAASFDLDLSALGGGAALVLASGFLDSAANQDGEGFALIAALPDGTVAVFEPIAADPDPIEGEIIFNGTFDDGLNNWTPFIADFAGVSADIAVVDGEAAITNITGAGGEVWWVQFNQEFTQQQIDALEVGEFYTLRFDARSNVEGRQLNTFFGEDGGAFTAIDISSFELTTSMETYEVTFEVGATFAAMKLGFEMGLENDDVFLDNISLDIASEVPSASIQIIHNSADPAVAEVDIYVNGDLFLSEVPFRGATPFVELATDVTYDIVVTPAGASINDGFSFEDIALEAGESYYVVATGVVDPSNFADNPDAVETGFFLDIIPGARSAAEEVSNFDFKIYHGATDAPAVDVIARDVATLAEGVSYTGFTPEYLSVPAAEYIIDVNVAGTETTAASFDLDLSPLGGSTSLVLASGFLDPSANQDGESFALIAVLTDGTVAVFEPITEDEPGMASVQIIHNSADPAVALVDIYVNGDMFLPDVPFRGATGFVDLSADITYDIVVTPAGASIEEGFSFEGIELEEGESYYVVATGVATPDSFAPNPDGIDTGFFLNIIPGARQAAEDSETVEFIAYHGATDAPAVDVIARDVAPLEEGLAYTEFSAMYIGVPADSYVLDINVAGTEVTAASFTADLSMLGGGTALVLASGFLDPSANQDGPGFALIAVLADGTVAAFEPFTSIEDPAIEAPLSFELNQNYPNPFNPTTNITYTLPESGNVTLEVFNLQGQRVAVLVNGTQNAGSHTVTFDANNLASGVYLYRLQSGSFSQVQKMMLVK